MWRAQKRMVCVGSTPVTSDLDKPKSPTLTRPSLSKNNSTVYTAIDDAQWVRRFEPVDDTEDAIDRQGVRRKGEQIEVFALIAEVGTISTSERFTSVVRSCYETGKTTSHDYRGRAWRLGGSHAVV